MKRGLKRGFTTGSCAAAATKAAAIALFTGTRPGSVSITLPSGDKLKIKVKKVDLFNGRALAAVIKDAGSDPDVTNGCEICSEVRLVRELEKGVRVSVRGGEGVGKVTRPGLKVAPGRPAINPVPMMMIKTSLREAALKARRNPSVTVTISVPLGEELSKKTMNARLGIKGGISILGTTGIVEPLSLSAYRQSIICAMDVAIAGGSREVVFSTGRSSEKAAQRVLKKLPESSFILVGDHMGFSLKEALERANRKRGLERVTIVGQFGKFTKLAAGHFETHCTESSIELDFLAGLGKSAGAKKAVIEKISKANTAREVFFILNDNGLDEVIRTVCKRVKYNAGKLAGSRLDISCILVGYGGRAATSL